MALHNDDRLYKRLDSSRAEIRLVTLPSSDPGDGVFCTSFRTISLDSLPVPEYYALSYVWGEPTMTQPIKVNGSELLVTPSLDRILRALVRHDYGPAGAVSSLRGKAIWIDALCINQADRVEKETQIPLMRRIYRQTTRVLSWVGDGEPMTDWALAKMNEESFYESLVARRAVTQVPTVDAIRLRLIASRRLGASRYWGRVWVLQETVLPHNEPLLIWGRHGILWSRYFSYQAYLPATSSTNLETSAIWRQLASEIPQAQTTRRGGPVTYQRLRQLYADQGHATLSLADVLRVATLLQATDARDYVFGLLGLVAHDDDDICRHIDISYAQPVASLYKDAFKGIWTSPHLNPFLVCAEFSLHRLPTSPKDLPSWAPDLSNQSDPSFSIDRITGSFSMRDGAVLSASQTPWRNGSRWELAVEGDVLWMEAIVVDHIDTTTYVEIQDFGWRAVPGMGTSHGNLVQVLQEAEALAEQCRRRRRPPPLPVGVLACLDEARAREPLWKTLTHWDSTEQKQHPRFPELGRMDAPDLAEGLSSLDRERMMQWEILMGRQSVPESWKQVIPLQEDDDSVISAVLMDLLLAIDLRSNYRKILSTKGGFVGVGTCYVEAGDVVVIVAGMVCPLVLRPFRDGYQMIGYAYMSGLMDWKQLDVDLDSGSVDTSRLKIY